MREIGNKKEPQNNYKHNESKYPEQSLPKTDNLKIKPHIHHKVVEIFLAKDIQYGSHQILHFGLKFCKMLDLTILNTLSHNFEPYGISTLFVLSESHCAIHYWPENFYLHIDLVTCQKKDISLEKLDNKIKEIFGADTVNIHNIKY